MNRVNKERLVQKYTELLNTYESILCVGNMGIQVVDSRIIKLHFKQIKAKFIFAKNSLLKIALKQSRFSGVLKIISGPTIIVFSNDLILASKLLVNTCKKNVLLNIIGGAIPTKQLFKADVLAFSEMPTQDEIRIKTIRILQNLTFKFVQICSEATVKLPRILRLYNTKK